MAIVISNDLTLGLRGRLGPQLVFRQMNGKTIACHAPRKQDKSKETPLQRQTRTTFREASAWAKQAMLDPEQKAFYTAQARKLQLPNGYTAAIKAYMCERSQLRLSDTRRLQSENCRGEQTQVILTPNPTLQDLLQVVEIRDDRFAHAAAHQRWRSYSRSREFWKFGDVSSPGSNYRNKNKEPAADAVEQIVRSQWSVLKLPLIEVVNRERTRTAVKTAWVTDH